MSVCDLGNGRDHLQEVLETLQRGYVPVRIDSDELVQLLPGMTQAASLVRFCNMLACLLPKFQDTAICLGCFFSVFGICAGHTNNFEGTSVCFKCQ